MSKKQKTNHECGASVLEFCAILPLFAFLLCIVVDVLMLFYNQSRLEHNAFYCQKKMMAVEMEEGQTTESHVRQLLAAEGLKPVPAEIRENQGMVTLISDYKPLTPMAERIMGGEVQLKASFMRP